jgi:hypothetical protein
MIEIMMIETSINGQLTISIDNILILEYYYSLN